MESYRGGWKGSAGTHCYVIDASNLHKGGGVQVAASLINEAAAMVDSMQSITGVDPTDCKFIVSTEVATQLVDESWKRLASIRVGNSRPGSWVKLSSRPVAGALTIFGPSYRPRVAQREVCGFALGHLLVPGRSVKLPRRNGRQLLLDQVRWARFRSADHLIVETEFAARLLRKRLSKVPVSVVPNAVSQALRAATERGLPELSPAHVHFASIARNYRHKNLDFLAPLGQEMSKLLDRPVRFLVTLTEEEYLDKSESFKQVTVNCGLLTQGQIAALLSKSEALIMPSLLETYSATPSEAMAVGVPVFVGDLPFMVDLYGDAASYFDPWNAKTAAQDILTRLTPVEKDLLIHRANVWLAKQPSARDRTVATFRILGARS